MALVLPLTLASLGELIASVLLNLGTAGVSKADFRFIDPLVERSGTGVFGTIPSSLQIITLWQQIRKERPLHAKNIIPLSSTLRRSESASLIHAPNMSFPS